MSAPDFEALLAKHEPSYQSDGDYGELQWVECTCGSDEPEDTDGYGSGFRTHLAAEIRREMSEWLAGEELCEKVAYAVELADKPLNATYMDIANAVLALVAEEVGGL